MIFILKSKIFKELQNVKNRTRKTCEKEFRRKLDIALAQQKEIYDLVIQEKVLEIETLENLLEQNKMKILEASEKEMDSKKIYLKAKEIISCVDFEFKRSLENQARSMGNLDKIRHEAEVFTKQMLLK